MKITLKEETPFPGVYQLDDEAALTGHEIHIIKKIADVRLLEIDDSLAAGDHDLFVALATIALVRAGKVDRRMFRDVADLLLDGPPDSIVFTADPVEQEVTPPQTAPNASGAPDEIKESSTSSSPSSDTPSGANRAKSHASTGAST